MKTTNFENSKKLAEIGFKAETKNWWMLSAINEPTHQLKTYNRFEDYVGDNHRAYDLETILEALPAKVDDVFYLILKKDGWFAKEGWFAVGYSDKFGFHNTLLAFYDKENESLADTASKLLIKLFETGIINFNK